MNSKQQHNMCSIDDHKLIKTLIQSSSNQKENLLDVGAGDFT
ncbi:MAG: hypothetical protein AB8U25_05005 [Rickettsiales endosymbiont of Dermacentor nuttalli]